ncbi:hypothetical protein FPV67DRAFT_1665938 [Lyophyllum atratum]|nr:hypothetical protein FPV67DRAFT_1665938 [Lyophyllum atratum]
MYTEEKIPVLPGLVSRTDVYGWPAPRATFWEKIGQGKVQQVASSSWVYGSAYPKKGIAPRREPTPPPADKLPLLSIATPIVSTANAMPQGSSSVDDAEMQSPPRGSADQDAVMASPPKPTRPASPGSESSGSVKLSWGMSDDEDDTWTAGAQAAAPSPLAKAYLRSGDFAPNVPWTELRDALLEIAKSHPEIHIVDCVQSSTMYRQTVWVSLTSQEGAELLRSLFQQLPAPPRGATDLVPVEAEQFVQAQKAAGASTTASPSPSRASASAASLHPSATPVCQRSPSPARRRSPRRRSPSPVRTISPPRSRPMPSPTRPSSTSSSPLRRRRNPSRRVGPTYLPRRQHYSPPARRMSELPSWEARSRRGPPSRERSPRRSVHMSPRRRSPTPLRWGRGRSRSPRRSRGRSPRSYDLSYGRRGSGVRSSRSRSPRSRVSSLSSRSTSSRSASPRRTPSRSEGPTPSAASELAPPPSVSSLSVEDLANLHRLTTVLLAQYGHPTPSPALGDRLTHPPPPLDARLSNPLPLAERLLAAPVPPPAPAPPPLIRRMQVTLGERVGDIMMGPAVADASSSEAPASEGAGVVPNPSQRRRPRRNKRQRVAMKKREGVWDYTRASGSGNPGGDDSDEDAPASGHTAPSHGLHGLPSMLRPLPGKWLEDDLDAAPTTRHTRITRPYHTQRLPRIEDIHQRTLHLYVEDLRFNSFNMKTSVAIAATVADRVCCAPGEWRVEAVNVLKKLQESIAELRGPGPITIGVPDAVIPEYTSYFVESSVKNLTNAVTSPTHLVVPASERASLTLRVKFLGGVKGLKMACEEIPSEDEEVSRLQVASFPSDFRPLEAARARVEAARARAGTSAGRQWDSIDNPSGEGPSSSTSFSQNPQLDQAVLPSLPRARRLEQEKKVLHHLESLVKLWPGYASFVQSRHAVLQNPDIAPIWRFATSFMDDYKHTISTISGKRITQHLILSALGIKETWYRDAACGTRLVDLYGAGGSSAAAEVIQELAARRDAPHGKGKLLHYLRDWQKNHS